ncbi:MAG TPA: hypothetical protein PLM25_02265 [Limnochordia bacterium]|jgi:uncharacterized membrane protein|nr:hypothetical protein [Limnochordia bacterium]
MSQFLDELCLHCGEGMQPGKPIQICPQCQGILHLDCWRELGRCPRCGWVERSASEPTKRCPYCREIILADAVLCKHCHSRLPSPGSAEQGAAGPSVAGAGSSAGAQPIIDALRAGWRGFSSRLGLHVGIGLFFILVGVVLAALAAYLSWGYLRYGYRYGLWYRARISPGAVILLGIGVYLGFLWLMAGLIKLYAEIDAARPVRFGQLFKVGDRFLSFLGTSLLAGAIIGVAGELWVVLGVVAGIFLCFAPLLSAAHGMGTLKAIGTSFRMVKDHFFLVLGLLAVLAVLLVVGAVPYGFGSFITLPVSGIALAHLCRYLLEENNYN